MLDCLRDHLHLTGTKKGCDHGQCGACTVHVNGRRVNSCLNLAAMREGDEITTIEGLGTPECMHPMQAAFVEHDGYQCGYCTAGQIMSATALLHEPIGAADAGCKRGDERQYLPLRRLFEHRFGDSIRAQERLTENGMDTFALTRASSAEQAIRAGAQSQTAQQGAHVRFFAGGTTLLDLMKLGVERPTTVIDINHLGLDQIDTLPDGSLKIGAMVRNADLAQHPVVKTAYAVLSEALLAGASAQLRNMATTGGNLLQRTPLRLFPRYRVALQ